MKELYSSIMMLAMMFAALSFTACSGSDEEDGGISSDDNTQKSVSVYLEKAGTLSSKISKSQASELIKLKIFGHMDARDFDYIKWDCMKIEEVDLSDVVIDSYTGVEGTEEGNNKQYAANEIPSGAFFYWQNVHKYIYDGMPIDEGMASLKKIVLPQGIKAIRRNSFARAYNLTEINIPEGVEEIDFVAFAICTSLEEIKLPSSLKTIGKQAFADMKSMKRLYVEAIYPPKAYNDSFQGIPSDAILYVPKGTENFYRNAEGWNTFRQIIGVGDSPNYDKSIAGVWEVTAFECSITVMSPVGDKMFLNEDGTYKDPENNGSWILNGNVLTINYNGKGEEQFEVISLTRSELIIRLLNRNFSTTLYLKRIVGDDANNQEGNDDTPSDYTSDDSEYFEININGEKFYDESWSGSVLLNIEKKKVNGKMMIPYGANTDMIRTSDGRAYQFDVFVGYVEDDWFGNGHPKSVGSYEVISSEGEYVISDYSDDLGMVVRGGGMNNGAKDFVVKSGYVRITKVSKASSSEKYVPDKSELYATEGNFEFILHDKRYDEDIPINGKFRLIY